MTTDITLEPQRILEMAGGFRAGCVLGAAAELDLFSVLGGGAMSADELAGRLKTDLRATVILLDALAGLSLLEKEQRTYRVPPALLPFLIADSPQTVLPMIRHQMTLVRSWSQLARVAKEGEPAVRQASIGGAEADRAAFIGAMHSISAPIANDLVARLGPPQFRHLLDVGGASGTWTLAFLRAVPGSRATIFDMPDAIGQARARIAQSGMGDRVALAAGDFYTDELPAGADLAWVSAIAHQHSREHNRELFAKTAAALVPGGRILIRDIVMEPDRTRPVDGALFAVNMLVNTVSGGTFTFDEFADDLRAAGFHNPRLVIKDEWMNSVVESRK
jgi:hypothetical protein